MPETNSRKMLTVADVVRQTDLTEYAVRQAIRTGKLAHRRFGRSLYIPQHAVDTLISGSDVAVSAEADA